MAAQQFYSIMLKLLVSTALITATSANLFPIHGSDGEIKFSIQNDGSAALVGGFTAPTLTATESLVTPSVSASQTLLVGDLNVATTFDANAAERAAMQQTIDKLEADSAANQIAEQEQNSRVDKIEADAATNAAADAELTERVSKVEADAEMAAKAEEEQNSKLAESEQAWAEKMAAQEAAFNEKLLALETKHAEDNEAQQKVLDQLVKIMSRFDVSGELESLRQANQGQGAEPTNPQ